MKLIFIKYPHSEQKDFLFGIQDQDALNQFLTLFNLPNSITKNEGCHFPLENELKTSLGMIKSQELRNLLNKYAGEKILILPEKDDYSIPSDFHYADFGRL